MNEINKKTILLFVFAIIFIIDTYCMIEPFTFSRPIIKTKYQPIIQQNPLLEEIRLMLASLSENETLFKKHSGPEIEKLRQVDASLRASLVSENCLYSIRNQTVEEAQYECMQYMLAKTIGFKSNHIKIMLENYASTCIDEFKYFKQTDRPKRNDIVAFQNAMESAQVVDVRGANIYAVAHIPGTVTIPEGKYLSFHAGNVLIDSG